MAVTIWVLKSLQRYYEHGLLNISMTNEQRELFHGWRPLEQEHGHQGSI
jgi:hypothetical protein